MRGDEGRLRRVPCVDRHCDEQRRGLDLLRLGLRVEVGLPVELVIGRAQNVLLEIASDWRQERGARWTVATEHRIVNRKAVPVDIEIRHAVDGYLTDAKVDRTSKPMRRKYGDFAWRFVVPPGSPISPGDTVLVGERWF